MRDLKLLWLILVMKRIEERKKEEESSFFGTLPNDLTGGGRGKKVGGLRIRLSQLGVRSRLNYIRAWYEGTGDQWEERGRDSKTSITRRKY